MKEFILNLAQKIGLHSEPEEEPYVKARKENGDPTFSYPCYPPWDESKTFRKMNTDTGYGRNRSDWKTEIGMESRGEIKIWWNV